MVHIIFFSLHQLPRFTKLIRTFKALKVPEAKKCTQLLNLEEHFLNIMPHTFSPSTENPAELWCYGTEFGEARKRGYQQFKEREEVFGLQRREGSLFTDSFRKPP